MSLKYNQRQSLRTKLTVFTLVIFVSILSLLVFLFSRMLREDLVRQFSEQQLSAVTYVANEINDELEARIKVLDLVAGSISSSMLKTPTIVQRFLDKELAIHPQFNGGVFVLSGKGIAIADSPISNGRIGINFIDRKYAIGALINGKPTIGNPVIGHALKSNLFSIAVPIRDSQGKVVAALAGTTDLAKPNFLDKITNNSYGKTGGYLLVAPEARLVITATDKSRIMQSLPAAGINPSLDRFIIQHNGSDVFINPVGIEVLASAKNVPIANWYVAAALPTSEAFAPIRDMQLRMGMTALILALLASILAWWMLKRQLTPILSIASALTAVSNTNQTYQPLPVTSEDEIGELIVGFNLLLENLNRQAVSIKEKEERYRTLVEWTAEAILVHRHCMIIYANPAAIKILGASSAEDLVGKSIYDLIHPDYHQIDLDRTNINTIDGLPAPMIEEKFVKLDGIVFDVEIQDTVINYDGEPAIQVALHDLTKRKQGEENLRVAASVFESTQEGVLITDANNCIVDVNLAFTRITGYIKEEVLGKNPKILSSGRQSSEFFENLWNSLEKNDTWRGEIWNQKKSGEIYPEMLSISVLRDDHGKVFRHIAVFSDISIDKKHEAELVRSAHFDALTSIPNRMLLADRMQQAISQTSRDKCMMSVCYLDLDGFKPINDKLGHKAGDEVLIEIAKRIGITIRGGDTVARLGGDEFVILLLGIEKGEECVTTLERLLAAISQPISVNGQIVSVSASIGVSIYPIDEEDPDTLLRHADQAMYIAKQSGKNRFHIYDVALDKRARDQNEFLKSIRRAHELNQFELHYQPKINLHSKELVGAEALIRWRHPESGLISPAEFLRNIENTDLDIQIGEWVTATALAQLHQWRNIGLDIEISINISGYHLESSNFVDKLQQQISNYPDLPFGKLQIEVLETVALNDIAIVKGIIESCRKIGVGFALDDFGTGYSSLSYLSGLPVDTLKIDQSFIRDMLVDKGDMAIVQGIIALAKAFERKTVAEGIETDEHYKVLLELGCEIGQGYGIARPMLANDLIGWKFR